MRSSKTRDQPLMWARILLLGPDNFKRVAKYQTLRTLFYGGFESVVNI